MVIKLLYLATVRLPTEKAHGLQIMKTCEAFASQGVSVELVVPGRKSVLGNDPFLYYGVQKNFLLRNVASPDFVQFGVLGFIATVVMFSEWVKWGRSFWDADIVYSRDSLVLLQYVLLGRKLVYEAHRKPSFSDRLVSRVAHRVVVITESLKNEFIRLGVDPSRIIVAHDAVDSAPSNVEKMEPDTITYAGSFSREKGIDTVVAAATLLPERRFVLVGDNSKRLLSLPPNVCLEGLKAPHEARHMLARSSVVLVPNSARFASSSTFTSPMKLFEALASGSRVVVADVPAIREVVDEQSVWFFEPDDAESLAHVITQALADPDGENRVARALQTAERYSWKGRAEKIITALV